MPQEETEEGPEWFWMITGTYERRTSWQREGQTHTVTEHGTMRTYVGDTYENLVENAIAAYAYKADPPPPQEGFTVLAIHLAPNITIQTAAG